MSECIHETNPMGGFGNSHGALCAFSCGERAQHHAHCGYWCGDICAGCCLKELRKWGASSDDAKKVMTAFNADSPPIVQRSLTIRYEVKGKAFALFA